MCPDVRIFTNGLLLDPETARYLAEADVHITLSADGLPGAQDHRAPGSFAALDAMLRRFRHDHPNHFHDRFAVSATLTSANVEHLARSFRYFVSRGVSEIRMTPAVTSDSAWGSAAQEELDRQLADIVEALLRIVNAGGEIPFLAFRGDGTSAQTGAGRLCGTASQKELFVDVDGTLAPCSVFAGSSRPAASPLLRKTREAFGVLRVTDPDVEERLATRERMALDIPFLTDKSLKRSSYGSCVDCPALAECFVCPASIALGGEGTDPNLIPAIQCDFNRLTAFHRAQFRRRLHEAQPGETPQ